jgi:hypothetical protein
MSYQLDDGLSSAEDLTRFSRHCTKWYRDGWRNECMFRSRTSVPRLDCCSRESHDVVCPFKVFLLSYPGSRAVWIYGVGAGIRWYGRFADILQGSTYLNSWISGQGVSGLRYLPHSDLFHRTQMPPFSPSSLMFIRFAMPPKSPFS